MLRNKQNRILADPFIMKYVEPLLRNIRAQVLLQLVKPYQRITLAFIADGLNITEPEVEAVLVELILDRRLSGRIDQKRGFLELQDSKKTATSSKYEAIGKWANALEALSKNLKVR